MKQKIFLENNGDTMSVLEGITLAHHYQLQRRLARGGMSEVYLAVDIRSAQKVAVKLVQRDNTEFCERFRREMYAIAELEHDHILPAFDYGEYGPWCYMVMPYIEHGTLRKRLSHGPLSPKEAGAVLEQLASALQYAHGRGIIHRDIKPSNVLLRDRLHVYLADFGLAKHLDIDSDSDITQTGILIGTPEYMAPELIDQPASISSDLYALGIVLYQMLTGSVPFKSATPMGIYWKHLQELPPAPSTLNPAIEPAVEQVLLHALEKDPQQRFSSAREFAQAYRNAVSVYSTITVHPSAVVLPRAVVATIPATRKTLPSSMASSKKRVIALAACVLLFLFALPAWLGFSLYSAYHHAHQSTAFTVFPLWSDHPVLPIVPTKPNLPPTATPTPTPTVPTQSGQSGKTGNNQPTTSSPQNDGNGVNNNNGGDNNTGNGGNNGGHQPSRNGHHKHGKGGNGGNNHKGKHKK